MKNIKILIATMLCVLITGCVVSPNAGYDYVEYNPHYVYTDGIVVNFADCFGCYYHHNEWYYHNGRHYVPHARRLEHRQYSHHH